MRRSGPNLRTGAGLVLAALLAGCAGAPSPAPTQPSASVAPTTSPAATPLPRADAADAALPAFARLIAREDLSFHAVETVGMEGSSAEAAITLDVAGDDFAVGMTSTGAMIVDLRHVDGTTFARIGEGPWRAATADERLLDDLSDPWLYLCWLDALEYTGPTTDPPDGLGFECGKPYTVQSSTMERLGRVGRIESLTLVLAPDGTPVRMAMRGSGGALATANETYTATISFGRVGERIVVELPPSTEASASPGG